MYMAEKKSISGSVFIQKGQRKVLKTGTQQSQFTANMKRVGTPGSGMFIHMDNRRTYKYNEK